MSQFLYGFVEKSTDPDSLSFDQLVPTDQRINKT